MLDTKNPTDHWKPSSKLIETYRQFFTTGVDSAGPILLRVGKQRNENITKVYIAIIVCFVTNTVHI